LKDDDYVICGYIEKANNTLSIVIAQYHKDKLTYKGHVMLAKKQDYLTITSTKTTIVPEFPVPKGEEDTVWIEPIHVCTVSYMVKSDTGALRQPVYKGLRKDKSPRECVEVV